MAEEQVNDVSTEDAPVENADKGTEVAPGSEAPATEVETSNEQPAEETTEQEETTADEEKLTASDYKLPEGVPADVAKIAEELGFTQEQLDGSLTKFNELSAAATKAEQAAIRQEGEALVREWGDNAKANLTLVHRALQVNDPTGDLAKALNETGYGNHPAVLRYLLNVGKQTTEGEFITGDTNNPQPKKTAAQVLFGGNHKSISE